MRCCAMEASQPASKEGRKEVGRSKQQEEENDEERKKLLEETGEQNAHPWLAGWLAGWLVGTSSNSLSLWLASSEFQRRSQRGFFLCWTNEELVKRH